MSTRVIKRRAAEEPAPPAQHSPRPAFSVAPATGPLALSGPSSLPAFAIIGLFVMAAVVMLEWAAYFMVPLTAAIVVGLTLGPMIDKLERMGLPPYLAGLAIIAALCLFLYGLFMAFAIPLEEWSFRIPDVMDRLREIAYWIGGTLEQLQEISRQVQEAAKPNRGSGLEVSVDEGIVTQFLASAPAIVGQCLIFLGTFYFFVVSRSRVRAGVLAFAPTRAARLRLGRIMRDIETSLSRYLIAITFVNIGLGVATGLAMWVLGLPTPALWGALAAVLNYVLFIGPATMAVILAGVALVTFDNISAVLLPPGAFLMLNLIESQFVTPTVLGQQLVLNPLIVFLSLAFWMWLWGPVGAFLALPLFVAGAIVLYHSLPPGRRDAFSLGIR